MLKKLRVVSSELRVESSGEVASCEWRVESLANASDLSDPSDSAIGQGIDPKLLPNASKITAKTTPYSLLSLTSSTIPVFYTLSTILLFLNWHFDTQSATVFGTE